MIRSSLELALLVLCIEFALIAVALLYFSRRAGRAQESRVVDNVTSLVSTVERSEEQRRQALLLTMQDTYRMEPEEAERVVSDFIEREHAFYNALIGVHLGRSGKSLADVPSELTKLIAPWLRIRPRGQVDKSEVEALQHSKAAVEVELTDTRKVLDELMAEYNAAFNKDQTLGAMGAIAPAVAAVASSSAGPAHDELLSMDDVAGELPIAPVETRETAEPPTPHADQIAPRSAGDDLLDNLLDGDLDDEAADEAADADFDADADAIEIEPAPLPPTRAAPPPAPLPLVDDTVIDLDAPDDGEAPPMSQADLDALLENLDDDLFNKKP